VPQRVHGAGLRTRQRLNVQYCDITIGGRNSLDRREAMVSRQQLDKYVFCFVISFNVPKVQCVWISGSAIVTGSYGVGSRYQTTSRDIAD
jgi:hypothetical protein